MANKLEDLRYEKLGQVFSESGKRKIPFLFHGHCSTAFWLTFLAFEEFENSSEVIVGGSYSRLSVISWYILLEDFISTLLFVISEKISGYAYKKEYKKLELPQKIHKILELLKIEKSDFFSKTKVFQEIQEFSEFRNELMHRNYVECELNFSKTIFSKVPFHLNYVDIMQSIVICVEFFSIFSNLAKNTDIMPQLELPYNGHTVHLSLLEAYNDLLKPLFEGCLAKHGLETDLNLSLSLSYKIKDLLPEISIKKEMRRKDPSVEEIRKTQIGGGLYKKIILRKFGDRLANSNEKLYILPNYYTQSSDV